MNKQAEDKNYAVGVEGFLPYTMSWIYRQFNPPGFCTKAVINQQVENLELFPHPNIVVLSKQPYYIRAIKAKLWGFFGTRAIKHSRKDEKATIKALLENKIQFLHFHFGTYAVYFVKACQQLKIPMIVTFHGFDISSALNRWPAYKKEFPLLLQSIRFAVVISEEMKTRLAAAGCPVEKIRVSYLGVPLDDFPFFERKERNEPVTFLHAGRLTAKKGVPDLIKAFRQAFGDSEAARLWIAGDGEEKELVVATIQALNADKNVFLLGRQSNEDLLRLRNEADVFVLNCRTDKSGTKEGLPIATLEAAATGLPAIATMHAGIPESVIDNQTGFLIPEFDNDAFANAMKKMMDKGLREQLGKNARAFMEKKFDLVQCNKVLSKIYTEALKK